MAKVSFAMVLVKINPKAQITISVMVFIDVSPVMFGQHGR